MPTAAHKWNPADYARHSRGQERWALELMELLNLRPGERVLDIGCGDGRHTAEIARRLPDGQVVGIDRSAEMIAFAKQHFFGGNLSFRQADASSLPFRAEFDVIFSNAVLHWIRDHQPVLAGISRSLRPGGRCVLQMGGKGTGAGVVQSFDHCFDDPKWSVGGRLTEIPYGFHGSDEYRGWVIESGLVPDSVELIEKDMVHDGREAFVGWLRTAWLPYVERVPTDRRAEFLQSVTDDYIAAHPPDQDGQVHVEMIRLQVLAHRPAASQ
jgi:trans-aconitate 2-methyltransferase